jgi:hypothetical protein
LDNLYVTRALQEPRRKNKNKSAKLTKQWSRVQISIFNSNSHNTWGEQYVKLNLCYHHLRPGGELVPLKSVRRQHTPYEEGGTTTQKAPVCSQPAAAIMPSCRDASFDYSSWKVVFIRQTLGSLSFHKLLSWLIARNFTATTNKHN